MFLNCAKFNSYLEYRQWHFKSGATRQLEAPRGVVIFHYSHFRWHFHSNQFHCWQNRHKLPAVDILLHGLVAGWNGIDILNYKQEIYIKWSAFSKKENVNNDYCSNLIAIRHRGESVTSWTVRVCAQCYRGVFWEMWTEEQRAGKGRGKNLGETHIDKPLH